MFLSLSLSYFIKIWTFFLNYYYNSLAFLMMIPLIIFTLKIDI